MNEWMNEWKYFSYIEISKFTANLATHAEPYR